MCFIGQTIFGLCNRPLPVNVDLYSQRESFSGDAFQVATEFFNCIFCTKLLLNCCYKSS